MIYYREMNMEFIKPWNLQQMHIVVQVAYTIMLVMHRLLDMYVFYDAYNICLKVNAFICPDIQGYLCFRVYLQVVYTFIDIRDNTH